MTASADSIRFESAMCDTANALSVMRAVERMPKWVRADQKEYFIYMCLNASLTCTHVVFVDRDRAPYSGHCYSVRSLADAVEKRDYARNPEGMRLVCDDADGERRPHRAYIATIPLDCRR